MADPEDREHEENGRRGIKRPLKIQTRFLLLLAVILIPILFVQALIYFDRFQTRRMFEMEANLELARAVGENFQEFVRSILYQEHTIGMAFTQSPPLPPDFLDRMLAEMAAEFPAVRDFSWADKNGVVVASSNPAVPGIDISRQEYFKAVARGRQTLVSNLFPSQVTGRPIFTISSRVGNDGEALEGVVVASILPEKLEEVLRIRRLREGSIGVIDRRGNVVVSYPRREWTPEKRNILDILPRTREALEGNEVTCEMNLPQRGERLMIALTPVRPFGWVAGASRPRHVALQAFYRSLRRHAGLFFVAVLMALAAALGVARGIINPIARLRDHARKVGGGNLEARVQVDSPRELKDLAGTLNAMAAEIQSRERQVLERAAEAEEGKRTLEALMNHVPEGITIADGPDVRIRMTCRYGSDLIGRSREELIGKSLAEDPGIWPLCHADGSPGRLEALPLNRAVQKGETITDEEWFLCGSDGTFIPILCNAGPIRDQKGDVVGGVIAWRDIRALKAAQEAQHRLLTIIEETPDLVSIATADRKILYLNRNGRRLLGFAPDADLSEVDMCHGHSARTREVLHQEAIPTAMEKGTWNGETAIVDEKGREIPVSQVLIAHRSPAGKVDYLSTILRDISELKEAAKALEAARQMLEIRVEERTRELAQANQALARQGEVLKTIIDNIPVMLVFYGEKGTMKLLNREAEKALGVTFEGIRQKEMLSFLADDPGYRRQVWKYMMSSSPGWRDFQIRLWDGRVLESAWANVRLSDGSHIGIGIDISERRRAEEEKEMYTRKLEWSNRELQDFAFVASHDLQEPLRKIQSFSHLLVTRYHKALDESGRDYLMRMQNATIRMQTLIQDLLDYSRVTTRGRPFEKVDLNRVVQDVLADLETRITDKGARIQIQELAAVTGDKGQLRQLFQNLISNALKFNAGRPEIRVEGEEVTEKGLAGLAMIDKWYRIRIADNGIGFDPRYLDRIFAPFQRLHGRSEYEGTGMGLAICRKIAERHSGGITARSRPGEGATFIVTLPFEPPETSVE